MPQTPRRLFVTGGAGFIGSNFVRYALEHDLADSITVFDNLTYSGNLENLAGLEADERYSFVRGDICDGAAVPEALQGSDAIVNFAAETHVDRSLLEPAAFIQTNIHGTWTLLESARQLGGMRFLQVSTDEVYGAVLDGYSDEGDRLHPRNPYSASKAGAEMMVLSYVETHGLDAVISRGSNTYGPYQYPEKFIPLMITNLMEGQPVPIYGDGLQIRHWIHVEDHCSGIATMLRSGESGGVYNIGSDEERTNLEVAEYVVDMLDAPRDLLHHVTDRLGHDRRYALSSAKLRGLGWSPKWPFADGIQSTIDWYRARRDWWEPIRDAGFQDYYQRNYGHRARAR